MSQAPGFDYRLRMLLHRASSEFHRLQDRDLADLSSEHQQRVANFCSRNIDLLDAYPEREFLVRDFLPHTEGLVLNVGVMEYNKDDHEVLAIPQNMRSIDIDEATRLFGSPYGHWVQDFLEFNPDGLFGAVVVFGSIGSRNDRTDEAVHIDLSFADSTAQKAANILSEGGRFLMGIELDRSTHLARYRDIRAWRRWLRRSSVVKQFFLDVRYAKGRSNLVVTCRRR